jgi:hypothetical protein
MTKFLRAAVMRKPGYPETLDYLKGVNSIPPRPSSGWKAVNVEIGITSKITDLGRSGKG